MKQQAQGGDENVPSTVQGDIPGGGGGPPAEGCEHSVAARALPLPDLQCLGSTRFHITPIRPSERPSTLKAIAACLVIVPAQVPLFRMQSLRGKNSGPHQCLTHRGLIVFPYTMSLQLDVEAIIHSREMKLTYQILQHWLSH